MAVSVVLSAAKTRSCHRTYTGKKSLVPGLDSVGEVAGWHLGLQSNPWLGRTGRCPGVAAAMPSSATRTSAFAGGSQVLPLLLFLCSTNAVSLLFSFFFLS